jgi:hypothetical protein
MAGTTANQQGKSSSLNKSRLVMIQQTVPGPCQSFFQANFPVAKFKNIFSDNSMLNADMEFFVHPALAWANASKRDQV